MSEQKPPPDEIFQRREEFGINSSIKMLTEVIETETNQGKRQGAIKFLGLICKEMPQSSVKKGCFNTLENILVAEVSTDIKCEAAKAMGRLKNEKALKPLKWVLEQNADNLEIKLSALKAIRKIQFQEEGDMGK